MKSIAKRKLMKKKVPLHFLLYCPTKVTVRISFEECLAFAPQKLFQVGNYTLDCSGNTPFLCKRSHYANCTFCCLFVLTIFSYFSTLVKYMESPVPIQRVNFWNPL